MLQELATETRAEAWTIASMLFFLVIWLVITVRAFRARSEDLEARARLALEGDDSSGPPGPEGPGPRPQASDRTRRD